MDDGPQYRLGAKPSPSPPGTRGQSLIRVRGEYGRWWIEQREFAFTGLFSWWTQVSDTTYEQMVDAIEAAKEVRAGIDRREAARREPRFKVVWQG